MTANAHPQGGPNQPLGGRRDVTSGVRADIEAIFRPAPTQGSGHASTGAPAFVFDLVQAQARTNAFRWAGIVLLVGLVSLITGGSLFEPDQPKASGLEPAQIEPQAMAQAPPRQLAKPAEPVIGQVEGAAATSVGGAGAWTSSKPRRSSRNLQAIRSSAPRNPELAGRCRRLNSDAEARCAYPAILVADRRLREAYARAIQAGVHSETLESYRDRWARLRRRSIDDPSRVIRSYGEMARDLRRLAGEVRS